MTHPTKESLLWKKYISLQKNKKFFKEKIHFYKTIYIRDTEDSRSEHVYFYVINDFKDITLDLNTIKQKSIELFHYYTNMNRASNIAQLNKFVS